MVGMVALRDDIAEGIKEPVARHARDASPRGLPLALSAVYLRSMAERPLGQEPEHKLLAFVVAWKGATPSGEVRRPDPDAGLTVRPP
ncbi:hypothetical protein GCM10009826_17770 [Humibacillus xanthopallidus]